MRKEPYKILLDPNQRSKRPGNLVNKIRWYFLPKQILLAFIIGVTLSAVYAPLEYTWLAWIGLVPIIHLAFIHNGRSWLLGYAFGFGHFVTNFSWLREVFILAPVGMATVCAIFPAFWLFFSKSLLDNLQFSRERDLLPRNDPWVRVENVLSLSKINVFIPVTGLIWCGMEWCRSWFLSGFPWNQLGISQWQNSFVLPISCYTGVYGVSFLIVTVNMTIYFVVRQLWCKHVKRISVFRLMPFILILFSLTWAMGNKYKASSKYETLKVAAIQGNIPQSRHWNPEQLELALEVYTSLTRQVVKEFKPNLIVWPETAIPASLTHHEECHFRLQKLFREINTPMIAGSITYHFPNNSGLTNQPPLTYNSALLFNKRGQVMETYHKIHIVPFGEFVPFEEYLPWLVDWIGMGRSLTGGKEYTVMRFLDNVRIGVNICYEDIFPEISTRMVRAGANVLFVITNDAWFRETSGSRQHLAHTVFRAVENQRPVLRNGNNSDTCLILPTGEIRNLLYDAITNDRFVREFGVYDVPIRSDLPLTFYARYGNWFAGISFIITATCGLWCFYRFAHRKRRLFRLMNPDEID